MAQGRLRTRPIPSVNVTATEAAYIAGLIDGEGSINISPIRGRAMGATITVYNSNREMLDWCCAKTGVGTVNAGGGNKKEAHHKTVYRWGVYARQDVVGLVPTVRPFLISKATQADALLVFCERRLSGTPYGQDDHALRDAVLAANDRSVAA